MTERHDDDRRPDDDTTDDAPRRDAGEGTDLEHGAEVMADVASVFNAGRIFDPEREEQETDAGTAVPRPGEGGTP